MSTTQKRRRGFSFFDEGCPDIALKSLFRKYDLNRDGALSRKELEILLKEDLGLEEDQCEVYVYILDKDGDSCISYEEFHFWLRSKEKLKNVTDNGRFVILRKAIEMFKQYDRDSNFSLDREEVKSLLVNSGGMVENIDTALKELDVDHNGHVSFQEFLTWLNWIPNGQLFFDEGQWWTMYNVKLL